jgi:DnaK suppressor protein
MPREKKGTTARLKKADLDRFRQKLMELRGQITMSLKGTSEQVKVPEEGRGYSQHQADEGTDDFDRQLSLVVTDREFEILRQIDRALEKIDDGTYGLCDLSGEPIPIKRLEAIPYASMTVEAQEKVEKGLA